MESTWKAQPNQATWQELEEEFRQGWMILEDLFRFPDKSDYGSYHFMRQVEKIKRDQKGEVGEIKDPSVFSKKIDYGYFNYPRPPEQLEEIISLVDSLGLNTSGADSTNEKTSPTPYEIIKEHINEKKFSLDFLKAWGLFNEAVGAVCFLHAVEDDAEGTFRREENNKVLKYQKYVFARWMQLTWSVFKDDEGGGGNENKESSINLFEEQVRTLVEQTAELDDTNIDKHISLLLNAMIEKTDDNDYDYYELKKTYKDLSQTEIGKILADNEFKDDFLPPFIK